MTDREESFANLREAIAAFYLFEVANVWHWTPKRTYDFVRTNLEYVPEPDWPEYLRRIRNAVAPGGRLIVCYYRNQDEPVVDVAAVLARCGHQIDGTASAPGVSVAFAPIAP